MRTAVPVVVASGTGDVQAVAATGNGITPPLFVGFSITEDAGSPAAARVRLHHGTSAAGPELFDIELAGDQSTREWFPYGIEVQNGLFVDRVSGTCRLTLYTASR